MSHKKHTAFRLVWIGFSWPALFALAIDKPVTIVLLMFIFIAVAGGLAWLMITRQMVWARVAVFVLWLVAILALLTLIGPAVPRSETSVKPGPPSPFALTAE